MKSKPNKMLLHASTGFSLGGWSFFLQSQEEEKIDEDSTLLAATNSSMSAPFGVATANHCLYNSSVHSKFPRKKLQEHSVNKTHQIQYKNNVFLQILALKKKETDVTFKFTVCSIPKDNILKKPINSERFPAVPAAPSEGSIVLSPPCSGLMEQAPLDAKV